ncbi:hypothetical protein C7B76_06830 [filamentous cyanobacterium CCP2]|nr:hypothetical protein C7B76_06830 [filamentous cyanobacterium CCP2]
MASNSAEPNNAGANNFDQSPDAALSQDPIVETSLSQEDVSPTGQAIPSGYEPIGEEVEGSTTPSDNTVDDMADAIGVELRDREYVAVKDKLQRRDDRRYELDPDSAES